MGKRERYKKYQTPSGSGQRSLRPLTADEQEFLLLGGRSLSDMPKKSSDMLKKLAEPWFQKAESYEEWQAVLQAAAIAWNLSLSPPEAREAHLKQIGRCLPAQQRDWLDEMILRKESLFPGQSRVIQRVWDEPDGKGKVRIQVLYTLDPIPATGPFPWPAPRPSWLARARRWLRGLVSGRS